ncbi:MAG: PilZ domain-containing protein [Bdellovibrionales bacterium]
MSALLWLFQHDGNYFLAAKEANPILVGFCVASCLVSLGIWRVKSWGYFSFLALAVSTLCYLTYQYVMNMDAYFHINIMVCALFSTAAAFFLQKHVSAPYFNPKLRWWDRNPRYRIQIAAKFQIDRQTRKGNLLDISKGGCFTELDTKLIVGEEIEIRIMLLKFDFTTKAKVIWSCEDPKGYGLLFQGMTSRHRKELNQIIQYLVDSMGEQGPVINKGISAAS